MNRKYLCGLVLPLIISILLLVCCTSNTKSQLVESEVVYSDDTVEVTNITYLSDGLKVNGYLSVPKGDLDYPCLIYCRGGNRDYGMISKESAIVQFSQTAKWGYVTIASQYRGAANSEGKDEFGGKDVNDVLVLINILAKIPHADTSRVGIWGFSRGGMMALIALRKTDKIDAAVIHGGASNLFEVESRRPEMAEIFNEIIPNYRSDKEEQLTARSAIRWPEQIHKDAPILLLHGGADWRVNPEQTLEFADKLLELRHPFRLVIFEEGTHSLKEYEFEYKLMTKNWFDKYVKDQHRLFPRQ